ncbi:helix-turn-helix transcriptional regulator [Sediminivirga luteola]|uniref:Putative DNA-binding protein n=1 Tax=Sediminivirga luteola TaxID=1774748 RepID=A0A8J2U0Y0_9MICO|nr:helix-turn-helix transcriptional regulator [Sediminivirga luteola]MCI2264884.1 helix-turn-helix transcriptional regulator [Sediminivirga luteola]GGA26563.1 putative DNA-binding protein [Sediminivirga luteola]
MASTEDRRKELGAFLRKRRERALRADYDLPPVGRSRTTGLRREEIAYLAGVSVTWYTWLEQGREINPSRQVLDAVALTLRLSAPEHDYVLSLAGFVPLPREDAPLPARMPAHLQRLVDAQLPAPAFAVTPGWSIGGWNRAYELLYPGIGRIAPPERNLLALIFTDPDVRRMLPDWEMTSRRFLAEYRAEAGGLLGHPAHTALITRLRRLSAEFAEAWDQHEVGRFASRERTFLHPDAGELVFEHHRLIPSDAPELHIVVYLPQAGTGTLSELERLLRG